MDEEGKDWKDLGFALFLVSGPASSTEFFSAFFSESAEGFANKDEE